MAAYRPSVAEKVFHASLRSLAKNIGKIINANADGTIEADERIRGIMERYSEAIGPWAEATSFKMHRAVDRHSRDDFLQQARDMSAALKREIRTAPTGLAMQNILTEQVTLIKSMPLEAAQRVHRITLNARTEGQRAENLVEEIKKTGQVTESRAKLIARTEVGRTAAALDQARGQAIGSPGYTWDATADQDTRPSHAAMHGQFVAWDAPPTLDGLTGHAGALPNCRCTRMIVIPDLMDDEIL